MYSVREWLLTFWEYFKLVLLIVAFVVIIYLSWRYGKLLTWDGHWVNTRDCSLPGKGICLKE